MSRNAGIDLLRGVSILLVIVHHVALRIPLRKTLLGELVSKRLLNGLCYNGYEAVFVFFVISGFLITKNYAARGLDVRAFYVRRASRILPCLVALVGLLCVLHLAHVQDYVLKVPLWRATVAALGLHLNWYEGQTGWLPGAWDVLWSLSIEEVFYLAFPLAFLLGRRALVPLLVLLALSLPWTRAALAGNEIWQEKAYLPGMAGIALGVLGALSPWKLPRWTLALGAAGLCAVFFFEDLLWKALGNGTMLVLTGSSLLCVMAFDAHPLRLPGTGWLQSFGRLSYECYLTHMFVVFAVVRLWRALGGDLRHGYLWYVPAVALSWALGAAVSRWFSIPAERALRAQWALPGGLSSA